MFQFQFFLHHNFILNFSLSNNVTSSLEFQRYRKYIRWILASEIGTGECSDVETHGDELRETKGFRSNSAESDHIEQPQDYTLPTTPFYHVVRIAAREVEVQDRYSGAHFEFRGEEWGFHRTFNRSRVGCATSGKRGKNGDRGIEENEGRWAEPRERADSPWHRRALFYLDTFAVRAHCNRVHSRK